ncbi:MAG: hydrogenase maturation protease [Chloroflexi bacterium]|nr:hydrogenase maturation protease [Chloroflexota bacterium]
MAKTLVLALGNLLRGDDGVGTAVCQSLLAYHPLPEGVELLDGGTPGLETALLLEGCQRAIIIDAADMGLPPGEWRRFLPGDGRLPSRDAHLRGTMHYAGLAEALALGDALGILPPEVVIYGIQPEDVGWQEGLSAAVATAVPQVAAAVWRELSRTGGQGDI